jgi:hypothetical protein
VANTSLSGVRVARELNWLMIERGKPKDGGERQWRGAPKDIPERDKRSVMTRRKIDGNQR